MILYPIVLFLIQILIFSEEATNFKARSIALASALKIDLADGIRAE
jgi:hypothetical protein